jgi:hypothetical protein
MEMLQLDDERIELKYLIPFDQINTFISMIFAKGFNEVYERREVNSIYYDDDANTNLFDSINGLSKRKKTRIRWYSNDSTAKIEEKIKINDFGYKNVHKLSIVGNVLINSIAVLNEMPFFHFKKLKPVSFIKYVRNYFHHPLYDARITLDSQIMTIDFHTNINRNLDSYAVFEIKYKPGCSIIFPFERFNQKFSKYQFSRIGLSDL